MARSFEYAVLRVIPDARRGECVNIGIAAFHESSVDVRLLPSLAKVSALNGAVDLLRLRGLSATIQQITDGVADNGARLELIRSIGVISTTQLGSCELLESAQYERSIARLMKNLVVPVPAIKAALSSGRITTTLKAKFRNQRILGADYKDIAKHLVVPNYPIDADEGLFADFVVKNGAYHVTETADLRAASASNIDRVKIASLTAIKLDKAKQGFGRKTKRYVVFAAKSASAVQQQINLMGDYSDAVYNLGSKAEMAEYMERIMGAASQTQALSAARSS
jgi:hypothetical protein